jgi:hypothetical protein
VGHELRFFELDRRFGAVDPAHEIVGQHLLPRHEDRHHRIQVRAREATSAARLRKRHVLGIFGREGWTGDDSGVLSTAGIRSNAFKMYRNYDGSKSTFGDTSVSATVANPDNVSAFANPFFTPVVMVVCKYLSANAHHRKSRQLVAGATPSRSGPARTRSIIWRMPDGNGSIVQHRPRASRSL